MLDGGSSGAERLKIACVTSFDHRVQGKNSWSHTLLHMGQTLQTYCGDVTFLGPMDASLQRLAGRALDAGTRLFLHKRYMYFHSDQVARQFGRVGTRKLAQAGRRFDVIFACGAVDIAYLKTDLPIVLTLDATQRLVQDYYPAYSNLAAWSRRELDHFERLAIQKAALLLFPSRWAARSAIADYQADPSRIHVAPYGADLDTAPPASIVDARRRAERCRLLFMATDWRRKGGDIAVETLLALDAMGVEAELVICGCVPPTPITHPRIRVIPFLNKQDTQQRQQLEALYLESDFLLLPTRSDCTPMVFCEAAAFGLPVITTDTGGVTEIVSDGVSGFALPLSARGEAYAAVIAKAIGDERWYAEMMRASRAQFDERLNWEAWAREVAPLIAQVAGRAPVRSSVEPNLIGMRLALGEAEHEPSAR